ncbi:MAG TPA: phosphoglycerate dehydrogenase [Kofleriaceae bacterium]|nr:phosphoglycerate dehydrogenase [Kofleriaceae bacterium]
MTKPFRVLISDSMSPLAAEILAASPRIEVDVRTGLTPGDLKSIIGDYHGLLVRSATKVTAEIIEAASQLEIIGRAGIGVDNIDIPAASRRGILVENAPSGNSVTTAEHAICLLLSLARHIPQATASMKASKWEKNKFEGSEIFGKTLGVIGLGNIGRIAADRAQGLHMKVIGHDPFIGKEAAERLGVELVSVDELLERSDFITIHTPLTDTTRGLLDARALARTKKGVLIVNAARGGIIDEGALVEALNSGHVGGAALDVFVKEPPPADHPLIGHPKVICTPHLGASTDEAQQKVAVEVAEQFVAYAERGEVRNALNVASVSSESRVKLAPWQELARALGAVVGQLTPTGEGFIDALTVEAVGEPGELGSAAVVSSTLIGLLKHFIGVPINEINAPVIAKDRGLEVTEAKRNRDRDFASAVIVTARAGKSTLTARGTLYHLGDRVEARIVQIDEFVVEVNPRGRLLAVVNRDQPGVIGQVGTLLGSAGINVASLSVGQDKDKGTALALWNVEGQIGAELLERIRSVESIDSALLIEL